MNSLVSRLSTMVPAAVAAGLLAACATTSVATPATDQSASPVPASSPSAAATTVPVVPTTMAPSPPPSPTAEPSAPPAAPMPEDAVFTTADVQSWMADPATAPGKLVFLTFDDGPNHVTTPQVLDVLKGAGVHATFFVVGREVPQAPDVLERTAHEGHGIALHSMTHDYGLLYPGRTANPERVAQEFDGTMQAVRDVLGADFTTSAWRYPGGHMSWKNMDAADAVLAERGATWLDWNALTGDAEPRSRRPTSAAAMLAMATQPIEAGYGVVVLLAHDSPGKDLTVESLPQIIDAYSAAGYTFGTVV